MDGWKTIVSFWEGLFDAMLVSGNVFFLGLPKTKGANSSQIFFGIVSAKNLLQKILQLNRLRRAEDGGHLNKQDGWWLNQFERF